MIAFFNTATLVLTLFIGFNLSVAYSQNAPTQTVLGNIKDASVPRLPIQKKCTFLSDEELMMF
jgi:hypothetical protein